MKILHGITRIGGGGAERQSRNLICGASGGDFQHSVFTMLNGHFEDDLRNSGCSLYIRPFLRWRLPLAVFSILDAIHREKPDVLHSWDPQFDVLFGVAALLCRIPFIASERNSAAQYSKQLSDGAQQGWYAPLRGPILKVAAHLLIANSRAGLRYIEEITDHKVRGVVIRNGIDLEQLTQSSLQPVSLPEGVGAYIVLANRLNPAKRTKLALDIFQEFAQQNSEISLLILGQGPEEAMLKSYASSLSASKRIFFLGHVPSVAAYARNSIAFLSASAVEGMPNSVIETMAIGVPAVLSRIDAHEELFEDSNGGVLLLDSDSIADGAKALQSILHDQELRERIVSHAKSFGQQLSIERSVEAHITAYKEVTKKL